VWVCHGFVSFFDFGDGILEETTQTRHGWSVPYVGWLNVFEARAGNRAPGGIGEEGRGEVFRASLFHSFSNL
jgi:hypothetical protein